MNRQQKNFLFGFVFFFIAILIGYSASYYIWLFVYSLGFVFGMDVAIFFSEK